MGYEIDFLPVGNGKNGDAICFRYGNDEQYHVGIVDGGTKESGSNLVEHIKEYYGTDEVDFLVSTHPDQDHISGLTEVLNGLSVKTLYMHLPWEHAEEIFENVNDGRITLKSLKERMKKSYALAFEVYNLAVEKGVAVLEPFEGTKIGEFKVMSPSYSTYIENLTNSEKTPDASFSIMNEVASAVKKVINIIQVKWGEDTLKEDVSTSYENENSVVTYAELDGRGILLTGDAGIKALRNVINYSQAIGVDLKKCKLQQIPHHGGRHNVSPSTLNDIVGSILDEGEETGMSVIASASGSSETHPRKMVTNGYVMRGAKVVSTSGKIVCYSHILSREGWSSAENIEFVPQVEEWGK